jgi:hypothetical protein
MPNPASGDGAALPKSRIHPQPIHLLMLVARLSAVRPGRRHLKQIGDRVPVALDGGEVVGQRSAVDAAQVPAA